MNILEVRNLTVWFPRKSSLLHRTIGHVKAVTGVSFVIPTGKTVGLVGESGSGKTTVGMAIMNLVFGDRRKHFVSWTGYHEPSGKRVSSVGRICALPIRSSQPSLQSAFERTELRDAARESLRSQWCSNSAWKLKNTGAGFKVLN